MWNFMNFLTRAFSKLVELIKFDLSLYALIALYTLLAYLIASTYEAKHLLSHRLYFSQWTVMFLLLMPTVAILCEALYIIHRFNSKRRLAFSRMFSTQRITCLVSGMALLMGLMIFQGSFTSIKNVLPLMHDGFPFDQVQADLDRLLHFGVDPWRPLVSLGGSDLIRSVVEWNYNVLWFILCFGGLFYVATSPRARAARTRYVVMFMATWAICGNLIAGLFLSAGPAFYGAVTGDLDRFAQLTEFLAQSTNETSSASNFQSYLWERYMSGSAGFGSGISAFPSVHVALIVMNALFLFDKSKRWGTLAFIYCGFIVLSSVYLGWHYAIDGYVSILIVVAMHQACKWIERRRYNLAESRRLGEALV